MLFDQIQANKRKTWVLLIAFFLLLMVVGAAVGYYFFGSMQAGAALIGLIGGVYALVMVMQSTDVVMSMNNAREIKSAEEAPELWHIVQDMAMVAQVPMPRVFIIDDPSPNAFATGNNPENAAVAATTGILQRLNRAELEGVMAHEMAHVRHYDIRLATIAIALTAIIAFVANFAQNGLFWGAGRRDDRGGGNAFALIALLAVAILAPLLAMTVQYAISRNREYLADAGAVELTRNPQGLISALQKISNSEPMQAADEHSAALYISNPLKGERAGWFDTHPPMSERIKRLEAI